METVLVVGCGNVLRGDDAVGPLLIRDLLDRGLPPGVRCADAGTGGMDVAFQMRGVGRVILIDACASGSEPGSIFELPGEEVENLPPLTGLHLHAFRWDHALAFARWLLKEDYPRRVTVYLVEAGSLEVGAPLSPPVEAALLRLGDRLLDELRPAPRPGPDDPLALPWGPQPLGVFSLPAGLLVLPRPAAPATADAGEAGRGEDGTAAALAAFLRGDPAPAIPVPPEWRSFALAAAGDARGALALLDGAAGPVADYDRFVLVPSAGRLAELRPLLGGELARLLEVAAYVSGLAEEPPGPAGTVGEPGLSPESEAVVAMARAARALEGGDPESAAAELRRGADFVRERSPLFAAQLVFQLADLRRATPREDDRAAAVALYREAIALARDGSLPGFLADLWLQLGIALQEGAEGRRGPLVEAVQAYQEALQAGLSLESDPEGFALAQNNLGLAYLSLPMREAGDELRMAVAVQSFRAALRVYGRDSHREPWTSAQLNLANSLQYLPSAHRQENLMQAVEIYEELLGVRERAFDPLGYARLLANQANALAHLGVFAPALHKLEEAHKLFHWHGEPDLAASALAAVQRIEERRAEAAAR